MSLVVYGKALSGMFTGAANAVWDWDTDTIKIALTLSTYSVAVDTDDFFNDVTNEVSGTGYTAGGATLASCTVTYDSASDQIRFDSADPSWTTSTLTNVRRAVIYKSTGTASTSPLIAVESFASDQSTVTGTLSIAVDATGWFNIDCT